MCPPTHLASRQFPLLPNHRMYGIAALADPNLLIALGDDGRNGVQFLRSTDAGCTWSAVSASIDPAFDGARLESITGAILSQSNPDHALLLDDHALAWVTFDGGNQWIQSAGFESTSIRSVHGLSGTIGADGQSVMLLAHFEFSLPLGILEDSLFSSNDGGLTFQQRGGGPWPVYFDVPVQFWSHPLIDGRFYFAYHNVLYRYDIKVPDFTWFVSPVSEGTVTAMAFHPTDPLVFYLGLTLYEVP